MTDDTPERDELLGFLAEDGRQRADPEDHPSIETLSAYGTGRLSEEESDRVQDHLVACRECSALVLSLKEILRAPGAESVPAAPIVPFGARKPPSRSVLPAYALAAVFALATVGLALYNQSLRARLLEPEANPPIVTLSDTERGSSREPVKVVQGEERRLFFALGTPMGDRSTDYAVEIRTREGKVRSRVTGLVPQGDILTFGLSSEQLRSGSYDVVLMHPDGTEVERFRLDLIRQ